MPRIGKLSIPGNWITAACFLVGVMLYGTALMLRGGDAVEAGPATPPATALMPDAGVAPARSVPASPGDDDPAALALHSDTTETAADPGEVAAPDDAVPAAANLLPERVRGRTIPRTFFGLHLLSVGMHGVWPDVPFGIYRTWDGVYRWHTMRPSPGTWLEWSLVQLDGLAAQTAGRADIMFTLAGGGPNGGFPEWLNPRARDRSRIHAEWRTYVRTLGTRLRGTVRYWEIWNEIDCTCFYDGPIDLLVELTNIAADELRAIDPANVILSAVNSVPDSPLFNEYLRRGGAANVDIVSWHVDTPHVPERDAPKIRAMRAAMERHGVGHMPLWTTEGHTRSFPGATPADDAAIMARHHLVLWSHDSENFSWYGWDVWDYGVYQGHRDWVTLTERGDPARKTAAGVAYGVLADWLIGASMSALAVDGNLWRIEIERPGGYRGTIVWHAEGDARTVTIPAGTTRVRTLDGRAAQPAAARLTTTTSPILLERGR